MAAAVVSSVVCNKGNFSEDHRDYPVDLTGRGVFPLTLALSGKTETVALEDALQSMNKVGSSTT